MVYKKSNPKKIASKGILLPQNDSRKPKPSQHLLGLIKKFFFLIWFLSLLCFLFFVCRFLCHFFNHFQAIVSIQLLSHSVIFHTKYQESQESSEMLGWKSKTWKMAKEEEEEKEEGEGKIIFLWFCFLKLSKIYKL